MREERDQSFSHGESVIVANSEKMANWFFRNRGQLPLVLFPVLAASIYFNHQTSLSFQQDIIWSWISLAISLLGLYVRILTIGRVPGGTSSRNTKDGQVADHLNSTGMYSIVRHPLYVGNYLMWLGIAIYTRDLSIIVIFSTFFWIMYQNIIFAEEMFLEKKYGDRYKEWSSRTPAFFPNFSKYQKSDLNFSLRTVLRKEYSGFFAVVLILATEVHCRWWLINGEWQFIDEWVYAFYTGAFIYLTLRTIKRTTRILHVEGR
jgi:protein-S-isoprenylcysteine O-methyltransferase Ste14